MSDTRQELAERIRALEAKDVTPRAPSHDDRSVWWLAVGLIAALVLIFAVDALLSAVR